MSCKNFSASLQKRFTIEQDASFRVGGVYKHEELDTLWSWHPPRNRAGMGERGLEYGGICCGSPNLAMFREGWQGRAAGLDDLTVAAWTE